MSEAGAQAGSKQEILDLVSTIVAAYVSNNPVPASELAGFVKTVHATLSGIVGTAPERPTDQKPAVPIKRSITDDYIVCLEDGKKLKMLKRYLRSNYKLTPDAYRAKWNLPREYPMVAPNYSARRSAFAKQIGLGRTKAAAPKRRTARR